MDFTFDRIKVLLKRLSELIVCERIALDGFVWKECGYKSGVVLPCVDESWKEFLKGERWGGKVDAHRWFYKKIVLPENYRGKNVELQIITGQEGQWDANNPQFIAYIDGETTQAIDINHTCIKLSGKDEYELYLYAYTGMYDKYLEFIPALNLIDTDTKTLYYHLKTPLEVTAFLDENSKEYADIMTHLNNAVNFIDLRIPHSKEYEASVKKAIDYMENEFYRGYCRKQEMTTICIGHTHIDVAWRWTLEQSVEKAQRSFATVVNLMQQYPDYKFMSSQAWLYDAVKKEDPALYEKIKALIAEGRWEVEGAMWLEADCNLPSGESLVRQIMFGKRFFKEEFGVESRVLWLPDVFGYSAALPQILRKSGVDRFVTSKISWNETNQVPYDTFSWEGIDGSEILSYFITVQGKKRDIKPRRGTTYIGKIVPEQVAGTWDRYQQKALNNETILTFGFGDGGGGPTAEMLETADRLKYGIPGCPDVRIDTATNFLNRLEKAVKNNPKLPKWVGELYLELHRGTYTSIAKNKRNNRKCEFLYQNTEWSSVMNSLLCNGEYPQSNINNGWQEILTRQFHDIIPGSSIGWVYDECDATYAKLLKDGNAMMQKSFDEISKNIKTDGGVLVFNPTSFEGRGVVEADGALMYASGIPAKGYKVIPYKKDESTVSFGNKQIENKFFKIEFDDNYNIISLYDKRNNREVVKDGERANVLQAFEDYPREWDAWEISNYYNEKMWEINDVSEVKTVNQGARAGYEITRKFLNSTVVQTVYLYNEIDRIDFDTRMDWNEEHILVKAAFPVDVHADKATYEVQFGAVERPTHQNTSWDAAKFEVCAQKFADLSEYGYGVSLLNDCKYGHDIHGNVMRLTLLKCATFPYEDADKGKHEFVYSLYPHSGTWREADTVRHAYELNNPLYAVKVDEQNGSLPEMFSLVNADKDNIIIDTVKKAEDSDDLIIRLYECKNMRTKSKLRFGFNVKKATICDLLENDINETEVINNEVTINAKPFEILTLKISR